MKHTQNSGNNIAGEQENVNLPVGKDSPTVSMPDTNRQDDDTTENHEDVERETVKEPAIRIGADKEQVEPEAQRFSFSASELLELVSLAHERGYRRGCEASRVIEDHSGTDEMSTSPHLPGVSSESNAKAPADMRPGRPVFMATPRAGFWD